MTTHDLKKATAALLAAALIVPHGVVAAFAQGSEPAVFQGVDVSNDLVTIKLSTAVQYNSFLTQTPPRLVMELLDTKHDGASKSVKGQGRFLAGVRSSQFEKSPRLVTRIVLDLAKMAGYKVGLDPQGLTVQLVGSVEDEAPQAAAEPTPDLPLPKEVAPPPAPPAPPAVPKAPRAASRAAAKAEPKPEPAVAAEPPAVEPEAAPVAEPAAPPVVEPPAAPAPEPEVAKPVKLRVKNLSAAAAFKRAGLDSTMNPGLVASVHYGDVVKDSIDIPADLGDDERSDHKLGGRIYRDMLSRLPRDLVTLDFDNTDIHDVLKLLAAKTKINIIYGADVNGTLTLHLADVPFNEAFRTILSMMQLTTDQVGENILRVITPAELTKQRTSGSAITKVVPMNYAKAQEVKATIDSVRQAEGRSGSSSVDAKTNSLILTESLEGMMASENLISQLDQRPRQVLIEAKLVEVNTNSGLNLGIQWDYLSSDPGKIGGKQGQTLVGTLISPAASSSPNLQPIDQNAFAVNGAGAGGRGTGVALSADRVFGALTVGRITNNYFLSATLTAAASEGKAKVLSDPKIATLNNQAASINVTTKIPYVTSNVASTGVQTQSVTYVETGITLTVTPSINTDGRILLTVNPAVKKPSVSAAGSTVTGAPAVDERAANTTVLVRDGETIVIGGLISDSMEDTVAKIPLLGDIPILGWLFKKKSKSRVRNELLIFVTSRILPD